MASTGKNKDRKIVQTMRLRESLVDFITKELGSKKQKYYEEAILGAAKNDGYQKP